MNLFPSLMQPHRFSLKRTCTTFNRWPFITSSTFSSSFPDFCRWASPDHRSARFADAALSFYGVELFPLLIRTCLRHLCCLWRMFRTGWCPFVRQSVVRLQWGRLFVGDRRFCCQLQKKVEIEIENVKRWKMKEFLTENFIYNFAVWVYLL